MLFSKYKWFAIGLAFIVYSFGLWHVSSTYTSAGYEKDKAQALAIEADKTKKEQDRADALGSKLTELQQERQKKQTVITKEVVREIEKPIYRECITPDGGVRIIEDAIDNANKAITGKSS